MARVDLRAGRPIPPFPSALYAFALGVFVLLATASLFLAGAQIQVDEGSYLLTAATLAGKLLAHGVNGYYSGYSVLLTPAFLVGPDPDRIFHGVLIINALMIATTPFALFRLIGLLYPESETRLRIAVSLAATCYAPVLLVSQHAMSESALVPLYAWLLATGALALSAQRRSEAVACGAIAGALLLVHPRGAAMAAPVLAILCLASLRDAGGRRIVAAMVLAGIAVAALHAPIEELAGKDASLGSSYSASKVTGRLGETATWFWIALNLLGSATEAIAASLGIFAVAICALVAELVETFVARTRSISSRTVVLLAMLLGTAAALCMSAVFFVPPQRADQVAYGRYAVPAVVPMLAIGWMSLSRIGPRRLRLIGWSAALALLCLALMAFAFTRLPASLTQVWNYINAPSIYIALDLLRPRNAWVGISECVVILGGIVLAFAWRSPRTGVGVFTLLNVLIATLTWFHFVWPSSHTYDSQRTLDKAAKAFESTTNARLCVDIPGSLELWQLIDLRWRLFPQLARTFADAPGTCVRGMVGEVAGPETTRSGMRLVAYEASPANRSKIAGLFVEEGPALDRWFATHAPPAMESFAALPLSERHALVRIDNAQMLPERITTGSTFDVSFTYRHAGETSRWTPESPGPYPILLGARVTPTTSDEAAGEYRAPFEREVDAGQSGSATIRIGPFAKAGSYRAKLGVVQEHVAWFSGLNAVEFEVVER